ncbi:MAG: GNAT family N-acetyltransferase [Aestuariibaculum sp.]
MKTLKGKNIHLRALEPEDLEFLYTIENDELVWEISNTQTPYSRYILKQYLEQAHQDIYEAKQLRLVVCNSKGATLGLIDLFDFDFKNKRAGIGIVIKNIKDRGKGYGKEAIKLLVEYSFSHLGLHQLYCNIPEDNKASIALFSSQGFKNIGLKQDWIYTNNAYKNEYLFQLIKNN